MPDNQKDYVKKNLEAAAEAVKGTRDILFFGMGNYMNDPNDPRYKRRIDFARKEGEDIAGSLGSWVGELGARYGPEVNLLAQRMGTFPREVYNGILGWKAKHWGPASECLYREQQDILTAARGSAEIGIGNCTEHAAICYILLFVHKGKPRPLEMLLTPDHALCAIGRPNVNSQDPADWGEQTIIVDAYYGEYYLIEGGKLHPRQQGINKFKGRVEN